MNLSREFVGWIRRKSPDVSAQFKNVLTVVPCKDYYVFKNNTEYLETYFNQSREHNNSPSWPQRFMSLGGSW